jgi:hypothetical protein
VSLISPAVYKEHDPGVALGDDALQRVIDANEAYMVRVLGPHTREGSPAVEIHRGGTSGIMPAQIVGAVSSLEETVDGRTWTLLAVDDWILLDDGRTLARLSGGTNSRSTWAPLVRVTYVPRSNLEERILALLEMVGMDTTAGVASGGVTSRTMGSWSETYGSGSTSRETAKAKVLARIHPTGGIVLR